MNEKIKEFYAKRNIRNIKIEFGEFGKFKQYICAVSYSKNNVDTFTDYFSQSDVEAICKL